MAELTVKELQYLNEEIEREGLTYTELQKELLDHLCCDVESKMDEGVEFLKALDEVKMSMGQDCIRKIQEDTLVLINKKYRIMKKFMYILGVIAPTLVIIGTIFKIQHWPAAGILLTLGLFLLGAIYLPVFVSVKIRDTRKAGKPVNMPLYIIGLVAGIVFIAGALFKLMHWPGAGIMMIISDVVVIAVFVPILVINALKDKENQVQNFTVLIFVLSFVAIIFMTSMLRVSKDVVSSFILAINNNTHTEDVIQNSNESLSDLILEMAPENIVQIKEVEEKADQVDNFIQETIIMLVKIVDKNTEAINGSGEINYWLVKKKEAMDKPAHFMLGVDYNEARGEVLKELLDEYKDCISGLENEELTAMLDELLDTSPGEYEDQKLSWVSKNFEHLPLMSVFTQLTNIQVNIRIVEGEVFKYLLSEANAGIEELN